MSADRAQHAVRESGETLTRGSGRGAATRAGLLVMRRRQREWADRNAGFFARGAEPVDEAAAIVLTGALMLAVAEVSLGGDEAAARVLAGGVLAVIGHIDITSQG